MDYSFERHQGCEHFYQSPWMYAEGKYICGRTGRLYFLEEIPRGCIKGFKKFSYPKAKTVNKPEYEYNEIYNPKHECKIYKFKRNQGGI